MTKKRSARRMVIKRSEGGDSTSAAPTVDDERVVSEELETAQAEEMGVEEREEIEIGETPSGAQKETLGLVLGAEEMAEEVTDAPSGAEEEEIETVVPKEGVSNGFANGGFLEESEMDFQVRDPTPLPLEVDAKEPTKYLICQTHPKGIIGGKLKGPGPFFMWIPDELVKRDQVRLLQIGDMVVIGDITLLWHKGLVWRKFLDEALRMTTVVTPEYVNLIANPWPQRSGSTIAKGDGMVPMAFEFYADRELIAQDESRSQGGMGINRVGIPPISTGGPVPFTVQAFPPISTPTAVGPQGRVFFNSSVRPATSGAESRPPVMYQPRIRPSVRTTPYPQQHPPTRASFASAAQQGQMNSNVGRTPEVICYRCRKIGHTQKFCRT
ncbi:hypothetical protein GPALN_006060 [Globodera pallida]|nr:hypothetical protein GPALN_006060 [Globodera pallida]